MPNYLCPYCGEAQGSRNAISLALHENKCKAKQEKLKRLPEVLVLNLSVCETARRLGITYNTLYRYMREVGIKHSFRGKANSKTKSHLLAPRYGCAGRCSGCSVVSACRLAVLKTGWVLSEIPDMFVIRRVLALSDSDKEILAAAGVDLVAMERMEKIE